MNRKAYASILGLVCLALGFLTSCGGGSSSSTPPPPVIVIKATSGTGQSATVGNPFTNALVVTVMTGSTPVSGATVTFTAPAQTGASGTFAGGANTATTNASGVATSVAFTANTIAGAYTVTASTTGTTQTATFNLTNNAGPPASIAATSGSGQSAAVLSPFANPLVATVSDKYGNLVSGASVTFTAPAQTGASDTFHNGTGTETDTTVANGTATSSTFTANANAGPYTVTATVAALSVNFTETNTSVAETIAGTSGGGQTAVINTKFTNPLVATVTQGGVGVSGVSVTFTVIAGASGASGTFATTGTTDTETTNASGVATTSQTLTANGTAGGFTVTATAQGVTGTATFSLTNTATALALTPGNYVYQMSGFDGNDSYYSVAGVFTLASDGATINGGEQDFTDYYWQANDTNLTGTVAPSGDGTGNYTITINTLDTCIGVGASEVDDECAGTGNGVETLTAALVSSSKAAFAEFDTWAVSSGTLELQNPAQVAAPSDGYAFAVGGIDYNGEPLAIGGILNVDSPGAISGNGSIFDANDDFSGNTFAAETFVANENTVMGPDSLGRVTFTLTPADPTGTFFQIILEGYIVDATHMQLVESLDLNYGITGGTAYGQGANTGTFSSSSVSGNSYVAGMTGTDVNGAFQAAGLLKAGPTSFTGFVNYNDLTGTTVQAPDPVTEGSDTYTVDSTGRVSIPGMTDGVITFNQQLYLDGNGHALAITLDVNDVLGGLAYQQTGGGSFSAGSFNGTYAMNVGGAAVYEGTGYDFNGVGPVTSGGAGTFSGSADLNWFFTEFFTDLTVNGAYTANSNGVFTGTITGLDINTPSNNDAFVFYLVDTTKAAAIEVDPNQLTFGYFLGQQSAK